MQKQTRRIEGRTVVLLLVALFWILGVAGCASSDDTPDGDSDGDSPADGDDDAIDGDESPDGDTDGDVSDGDITPDGDLDGDLDGDPDGDDDSPQFPVLLRTMEDGESWVAPDARGLPGDYVMENEHVRFIIESLDNRSRSWIPEVGNVIDVDLKRADGEREADLLGELTPMPGLFRAFCPDGVEVVADGSDGNDAVLRFTGRDCGIELIDMVLPMASPKLDVVLEYRLAHDGYGLKVTTSVTRREGSGRVDLGDGLVWSNRARVYTPGLGFGMSGLTSFGDFDGQFAFADNVAVALIPDEGQLSIPLDQADILPFIGKDDRLSAGDSMSYSRWLMVGESLEALKARILDGAGVHQLTVSFAGDPIDAADGPAWLEVRDADDVAVSAMPLPAETVQFGLLDGDYTLSIVQGGRPTHSENATVSGADASTTITVPETGRLVVDISGSPALAGDIFPCRIIQYPQGSPATVKNFWDSLSGNDEFLIEPGDWTIAVSRGFEYDLLTEDISVTAGQSVTVSGTLTRVVDTDGWLAGDLHMHTELSIDSNAIVEHRVSSLAAVGLEYTPITDHDHISDLKSIAEELGLDAILHLITGVEISPPWAHSNAYPVVDRADVPEYFGVAFTEGYDENGAFIDRMEMPEVWALARDDFGAKVIQINHPRSANAYFDVVGFDPTTGVAAMDPEIFDASNDLIELVNSGDIDDALEKVLTDWYSLLNEGHRMTGVAVSDSHDLRDPGVCRTWVNVDNDDPTQVGETEWSDALKAGKAVAGCGPFVTMSIGDAAIGDTVQGAGPHTLSIRVQAPGWLKADWVRVIINGAQIDEIALPDTAGAPLDYSTDVVLPSDDSDFWVVVLAGAPQTTMAPLYPGKRMLSITNPIFVDVDSDGYTAPGPPLVRTAQ